LPDLSGLRFLHAGWWLGTLRKDRFEPSHALALGLKLEAALRAVSLSADDPNLRTFLGGGSFSSPGEDGWILVAVDGHPVGWGKRVAGTVKSHYPKGLRRA
jgi:NOL1/NOP2/fmu family ribosome biogenesis protein